MVPTKEEVLEALRRMRKWQESMEAESLANKELILANIRLILLQVHDYLKSRNS